MRTFAALPGWRVRGITRNPASEAAKAIQAELPAVELVAADLDSPDTLVAAFTGAHAIFTVTDFWQFMRDEAVHKAAAQQGITANVAAFNAEIQHGKNMVDAAAKIAGAPGSTLERLVMSTLSDSRKLSGGKYTWNYHFEGKAKVVEYLQQTAAQDASYKKLLDVTSYVQIGFYFDNWRSGSAFGQQKVCCFFFQRPADTHC